MDEPTSEPGGSSGLADRAWVGYHPRALLPAALAVAALTAVVWTARWGHPNLATRTWILSGFALTWAAWLTLAAVFLYRTTTYTYRLTDRALLVDFGPLARPTSAILLSELTAVTSGAGPFGRRLEVGWVELRTAARVVRLTGVRHPGAFAERVRAAAGLGP